MVIGLMLAFGFAMSCPDQRQTTRYRRNVNRGKFDTAIVGVSTYGRTFAFGCANLSVRSLVAVDKVSFGHRFLKLFVSLTSEVRTCKMADKKTSKGAQPAPAQDPKTPKPEAPLFRDYASI